MKTGIELIAQEQIRVRDKEGFNEEHDEDHNAGQLLGAAGCYIAKVMENIANNTGCMEREHNTRFQIWCDEWYNMKTGETIKAGWKDAWPFEKHHDKRDKHENIKLLVQAGQFIAAEIDRINATEQK